ncbi:hypothetical protein OOT46_26555 [Aquabacterium sp. A7-Y]|uniref:hypothetical protein n=1 Tax=Aquabacterium sp. A7-Y TaxID=1349605 RepID=UPI00223D1EA5|nr:hypothetical protein [Aquabacterium sp. A7-Y]MCW7541378.1 hypothetical protein [Aquabacterium sp. A7-Y]
MPRWPVKADAVRTARVPARLSRWHGTRPLLEHWLADADVSRHGLPSQAIVLVRRLQAPWALLGSRDRSMRYGPLAAALAGASRPAHGEYGGDAVWFADEAELLACLARDALAGALLLRWWWRVLLRELTPVAARAVWWQTPRQVPRALLALGEECAVHWLQSWGDAERQQLIERLAQVFPIALAVRVWAGGTGSAAAVVLRRAAGEASRPMPVQLALPSPALSLYRLAVALTRDPMAASEPARAVQILAVPGPVCQSLCATPERHRLPPAAPDEPPALRPAEPREEPQPSGGQAVPTPRTDGAFTRPSEVLTHEAFRVRPSPAAARGVSERFPASGQTAPELATPAASTVGFDSAFGGLLFLLNAALQLGLYGDFTQPLQRGLSCSPWRFLRVAGCTWAGCRFRADPLSDWLHDRDPSRNPVDLKSPMPASWLAPFVTVAGVWRAVFEEGRLRLHHPAGFAVFRATAAAAQCEALMADELERLGAVPLALQRVVVARARGCARQRPAPLLWPYLRARLALALGLEDARQLSATLLRLPAHIQHGAERLDLHMALDALPLAVRLAGLDRDPGWIPAAGCDLRFHFH